MSRFRRPPSLAPVLCGLVLGALARPAAAATPDRCEAPPAHSEALQLEVFRNGEPTSLVGAFTRTPDGRFFSAPAELRSLGLVAVSACPLVPLDGMAGVNYRYDDPKQQIFFQARAEAITPLKISLRGPQERAPLSRDSGALLNYSLAATSNAEMSRRAFSDARVAGSFEARAFGPFGVVSTEVETGLSAHGAQAVRLDSDWTYSQPRDEISWIAGDTISGGFAWTRPLRLGGFQIRRDFSTRPDLVVTPTPVLSASAAAPSTLEVMLGSSTVLSRPVSAGPIEVSDLPVVQGGGEARLVLRDALGREQLVTATYFATPELLRPGVVDFSVEGGFARRRYGLSSDDYNRTPVASGSVRYGLSDTVTLQAHGEGGDGLINGGAGAVVRAGAIGVASVAVAGSRVADKQGDLVAAAFESRVGGVTLSGQAQATRGDYRDLAAVTIDPQWRVRGAGADAPPKTLIQLSASAPLTLAIFARHGNLPTISASYGQIRDPVTGLRSILSAAFRYSFRRKLDIQISAYATRTGPAARPDHGLFFSLIRPLGRGKDLSAGVDRAGGQTAAYVEMRQQEQPALGAVAWRLRADGSEGGAPGVEAEGVYRSAAGRLDGQIDYRGGASTLSASLDGALVWLGGLHLAPDRLERAFAVVDVGAPGIPVRHQNRLVGISGADGEILVPNLNPYEGNRVDIDVEEVPLNLETPTTRLTVNPPAGAGAIARFGVTKAAAQATVPLRLTDGAFVPAGARASLNGGLLENVVGYDGRVFVAGLKAANVIQVDLGDGASCKAEFSINLSLESPIHVPETVCR